jgi:hypothetical protein
VALLAALYIASRALIIGLSLSSSIRVSPDSRVVKRLLSVSLSSSIKYVTSILRWLRSSVLSIL